jgi:hypothetical protein
METQTQVEPVMFFSRAAHLTIQIRPPRRIMQDGQATLVDEKIVSFSPQSDNYGRYVTNDPDVIAALEKNRNVMSAQQYQEETTPLEIRLQMERDDKKRLITDRNEPARNGAEARG